MTRKSKPEGRTGISFESIGIGEPASMILYRIVSTLRDEGILVAPHEVIEDLLVRANATAVINRFRRKRKTEHDALLREKRLKLK